MLGGGRTSVADGDELLVLTAQDGVLVAQTTGGDDLSDLDVLAVATVFDHFHAENLVVGLVEVDLVDQLAFEVAGVARVGDFHLAHHLADDDFEVLVVDLHTLQTVDLLHLVDDVLLHLHRALDGEDVSRCDGTVGERRASLDIVAVLSKNLLGGGDEIGALFAGLAGDGDLTVVAFEFLVDGDNTVDFSHDGGVGRVAGFEELGDAGQTAGNIASLTEAARNLDHDVTSLELLTLVDTNVCTHGKVVDFEDVAIAIDDVEGGVLGALAAFDDYLILQSGLGIALDTVGDVLDNILEGDATGHIGDNDGIVGVPFGNEVVLCQAFAGLLVELGTVGQQSGEEGDVGVLVDDAHLGRTTNDNLVFAAIVVGIGDGTEFVDFETAFVLGSEAGVGTDVTTSNTTDVEGTEGKLGTRFTDGLCSNDTDGFALLNHLAGGKVTAITLGADAVFGLAGEHGADFDLLDGRFVNDFADVLGEFLTGGNDELASVRMIDIVDRGTTQQFFAQGDDDVFTFLEGRGGQAAEGAAVLSGDDDIMSHVDQTTGEVTSVSGLKSGIGQTFTGTVGGDEVLQHGKAFFKVRNNGVLNNFVASGTCFLRLGHQSAHAGELTNLLLTTTSTGIVHHIDGVEALVVGLELLHEGFGETIVGVGPNIDDVVVTLVVGDKTHGVLTEHLFDLFVGLGDEFLLLGRNDNVAQVEREATTESLTVTHVLDVVEEVGSDGIAASGEEVADDVAK